MSAESPDFRANPNLNELRSELLTVNTGSISIGTRGVFSGLEYRFDFVSNRPRGDYIRISTMRREEFSTATPEQHVQIFLVNLTLATREVTGGAIDIHPHYGAIYGNGLTPISGIPDQEPNRRLSMTIYLTDYVAGLDFGPPPQTQEIGTVIGIASSRAERDRMYFEQARNANPNQKNRDRAKVDRLQAWDSQFLKFNGDTRRIPNTMPIGPNNIADLMNSLVDRGLVTDVWLKKSPVPNDSRVANRIAIPIGAAQ